MNKPEMLNLIEKCLLSSFVLKATYHNLKITEFSLKACEYRTNDTKRHDWGIQVAANGELFGSSIDVLKQELPLTDDEVKEFTNRLHNSFIELFSGKQKELYSNRDEIREAINNL